jgi:hypothetical protein
MHCGIDDLRICAALSLLAVVSTFLSPSLYGFADGSAPALRLSKSYCGVAVDASGVLYFNDVDNQRVRKVTANGAMTTTLAGGLDGTNAFFADGAGTSAGFTQLVNVAVDSSGNVFVSDSKSQRIRKISTGGGTSAGPSSNAVCMLVYAALVIV